MADIDFYQDNVDDTPDDGESMDEMGGDDAFGTDDSLTALQKLEKYMESDNVFTRQMVARGLLDTLRAVGDFEEQTSAVLSAMVRLSQDSDPIVRSELMEQVPHIAVYCQEHHETFQNAVPMYVLPMVVRFLNDSNNQVRKTSQAALLVLLEQDLMDKGDVEEQVMNVILELSSPDSLDDYRTEAAALMSKMAPLIGKEMTEKFVLSRFCEMCSDPLFHVRKVCAANFGDVCTVVGQSSTESQLLPEFYYLCEDGVWGVRKACAECFMAVSCACSVEMRKKDLATLFVTLLCDQSRWVRMAAFQQLGPFISTFANAGTGLYVNEDGFLSVKDAKLLEGSSKSKSDESSPIKSSSCDSSCDGSNEKLVVTESPVNESEVKVIGHNATNSASDACHAMYPRQVCDSKEQSVSEKEEVMEIDLPEVSSEGSALGLATEQTPNEIPSHFEEFREEKSSEEVRAEHYLQRSESLQNNVNAVGREHSDCNRQYVVNNCQDVSFQIVDSQVCDNDKKESLDEEGNNTDGSDTSKEWKRSSDEENNNADLQTDSLVLIDENANKSNQRNEKSSATDEKMLTVVSGVESTSDEKLLTEEADQKSSTSDEKLLTEEADQESTSDEKLLTEEADQKSSTSDEKLLTEEADQESTSDEKLLTEEADQESSTSDEKLNEHSGNVHIHSENLCSFNSFQYWRTPLPELNLDFNLINGQQKNILDTAKVKDDSLHKVSAAEMNMKETNATQQDQINFILDGTASSIRICDSNESGSSKISSTNYSSTSCTSESVVEDSGVKVQTALVCNVNDAEETLENLGRTNVQGQQLGEGSMNILEGGIQDIVGNNWSYIDSDFSTSPNSSLQDSCPIVDDATLAKQQDIVPQNLLENYLGMIDPSRAQTVDTEITKHCAYNLPAVAYTLGRKNWHCIKNLYETLAADMQWKVRRTLAFSIHELAVILGDAITRRDLVPVFDGFLKDLDEVRIGILRHLADFLRLLQPNTRRQYLIKVQDFMNVDNQRNWRFRLELAEQLVLISELFLAREIYEHLLPLGMVLAEDKVAEVRREALRLISGILRRLNASQEEKLMRYLVNQLMGKFAHNQKWSKRQLFVQLCEAILKEESMNCEQFAKELMPSLLKLGQDPVPNVRITVARCMTSYIVNRDYFTSLKNPFHDDLLKILQSLQSDSDRDVRFFCSSRVETQISTEELLGV
ncbi:hypothetical protein CHS0354_033907 [Potamilus streckersoni]|uniref:Phosphatase 2A Regulatory Subunit A helical domain-containing protein n=1 Tax=Potamilus streckersoni TaxID=2493646 RepID=A0AAE0VKD1_9BIVA|nr:hypothetical protein CHS0354_033907 [Potamilus streckersoni]